MWQTIKDHKWLVIGVIAAVVIFYYLVGSSGTTSTAATSDAGDVAAATALQQAQDQAASQSSQMAAELQANQDTIGGQIALATIQGQTSNQANQIAANVDLANISATQQTQSLLGTLEAGVQTNAQNQATQQLNIQTSGAVQQQTILANALIQESNNQLQANMAQITAAQAVTTKAISCSGFKALFGGC